MENVTDSVFRRIIASYSPPDVFFTEFVAARDLRLHRTGSLRRITWTAQERPLVVQLWGIDPDDFFQAARLLHELGYDGIDINMGCSVRKIARIGAGAGLIGHPERAIAILDATRSGAGGTPVSVKTRIGRDRYDPEGWIAPLLRAGPAALTVHGRPSSRPIADSSPADWRTIREIALLRDTLAPGVLLVGNGDVSSVDAGVALAAESGVDGVMIGRAALRNPSVFYRPGSSSGQPLAAARDARVAAARRHVALFAQVWGDARNFAALKKYLKCYLAGYEGAEQDRARAMAAGSLAEFPTLLESPGLLEKSVARDRSAAPDQAVTFE